MVLGPSEYNSRSKKILWSAFEVFNILVKKFCAMRNWFNLVLTRGSLASLCTHSESLYKSSSANYEISIYIIVSLEGKSYTSR